MAAIHVAVDAATTSDRDVVIFTDCSTLLWNLIGMLQAPQRYAGHKHDIILTQIAAMLRASTSRIKILKVKAHVGIAGNEYADAVAKDETLACQQKTFSAAGDAGRGCAWVRYPADPTQRPGGAEPDLLYDADNLNGAVLDKARQAHQRQLWDSLSKSTPENQTSTPGDTPSDTRRAKKGAAERLHDVHEQSGGVHEQISYGFWKQATSSRHSHIQPILRARFDRLMTQKRRFRVLPVG